MRLSNFVCVDGEGMDTSRDNRKHTWERVNELTHEKTRGVYFSKEHIYTFLASSSGRCIRNWDDGLSTVECFEFLLSEKKEHSIMVGFSINYDVCMMLRDVNEESLQILWDTGRTFTYQEGKLYKLDYFPSKWFTVSEVERVNEKIKIIRSAKVWDVFGFFQHSFIRSLEEWIPETEENILNTIARMKEQRGNFTQESQEEIESYCLEECKLLELLMEKLRGALESADIHLKSWHGAGAISGYLYAQHNIDRHVHWDDMPELAQQASLSAYFGGRVELFTQGFIEPPIYEHDINSAYPAAIVTLPSLRRGTWYGCNGGEVNVHNPLTRYGLWFVEWDVSSEDLYWLSPFPQRSKDGGIYWSTRGKGWYHTSEVLAGLSIFGRCIRVERGVYFIPANWEEKPFSWLEEIMEKRLEYKQNADPRNIIFKLGANSGYGKLAQGNSSRGFSRARYQNYWSAGYITASCRSKMLATISQFNREDVICAATDGVYTRTLCDGIKSCPGILGSWEIKEKKETAFFGQAGIVFTPSGKEVKSRGFRKTSISYSDIEKSWCAVSGDWSVFGVNYHERRFNGLGYVASTGRWDEFRRWVDREREFSLRTEPRKEHCESENGSSSYLLEPGKCPESNIPYSPKEVGSVVKDEELLELLDLMDQPEYVG